MKKHFFRPCVKRLLTGLLAAALILEQGGAGGGFQELLEVKAAQLPEPDYLYTFEEEQISGSMVNSIGTNADAAVITGAGLFEKDADGGYFNNVVGKAQTSLRENYLSLPSSAGSGLYQSKGVSTIAMWIKAPETGTGLDKDYGFFTPLFAAKNSQITDNFYPAFNVALRGTQQINCDGWFDNTANAKVDYLEDHAWHYVAAVFDGSVSTVYIDGTVYNTTISANSVFTGTDGANLDRVSVGGDNIWAWDDPDAGLYFDDVAVYYTALTSAQIQELYQSGRKTAAAPDPDNPTIRLTDAELDALYSEYNRTRQSVHDPSIVVTGEGTERSYYVFGSHMATAKTKDLENWDALFQEDVSSALFGNAQGAQVPYTEAFKQNQITDFQQISSGDGSTYTVDFGSVDAAGWCTAVKNNSGENWTVQGNMWAPDVIFNAELNKWCMYLSLNGNTWNSVIILLTSDQLEGPYVYQAPVVFSGFVKETNPVNDIRSYKNTDLEQVRAIGELAELPQRYRKMDDNSWGTYWPHAIDPVVFYDEAGKLWMSYGSWFGGIYVLDLDEKTGLRDYLVNYGSDYDEKQKSVTCDPYFGKKIAGGYGVSGEGSYIEYMNGYYYLFLSYGFYSPDGGYEMRVFRSENPDGPYVDPNGKSAIYDKAVTNYGPSAGEYRGLKLMGNYQWATMKKGEVAQGHNSAFADTDGKYYVIYHTKFDDGTAGHELRVHQLYFNESGWPVAAPFEYAGETISGTGYSAAEIAGEYDVILHHNQVDYASLETVKPVKIRLNQDGTIGGAYTGSWTQKNGTAYVELTLGQVTYQGVFCKQNIDNTNVETMCFTAIDANGIPVWGARRMDAASAVAFHAKNLVLPQAAFGDLTLPAAGNDGVKYSYTSANPAVISDGGQVTLPVTDTVVTMTVKLSKGDYYYERNFDVKVFADRTDTQEKKIEIASIYQNTWQDLSGGLDQSLWTNNPFYFKTTSGIDLTYGASIEFDVEAINPQATPKVLATLLSFLGDRGAKGKLYFTPGSYLGYNANGQFFDANLKDYTLVTDYINGSAHVELRFTPRGFSVYMNGTKAYDQKILSTENGNGDLTDYSAVLDWLKNTAERMYFGYGSWWSVAGHDEADAKIQNVTCSVITKAGSLLDYSDEEVCGWVDDDLKKQIPLRSSQEINLPTVGIYDTTISWTSDSSLLEGTTVRVPETSQVVTLTAKITYGSSQLSYEHKIGMKGSKAPFYEPDTEYAFQGSLDAKDGLTTVGLTGSKINTETDKTAEFFTETDDTQAIQLSGAGSYGIRIPETVGEQGISFVYRVKADSTTANTPQVFLVGELETAERWISIGRGWKEDGTMMIWSRDSVSDRWYDSCVTPFTTGEWHTVAVTLKGTEAVLYVDGVRSIGEIPDIIHPGLELYLGVNAWDTPFNGKFSQFHIFNRVLTEQELLYYFCDGIDLKPLEQLPEGAALDPADSAGNTWLISTDSPILKGNASEGYSLDLKDLFTAAVLSVSGETRAEVGLELTTASTTVGALTEEGVSVTLEYGKSSIVKTFKLSEANHCKEVLIRGNTGLDEFVKPNISAYSSFQVVVIAVPEQKDKPMTDSLLLTSTDAYEAVLDKKETDAENRTIYSYTILPKTTTGDNAEIPVICGAVTAGIPYKSTRLAPENEISYPLNGGLESGTSERMPLVTGGSKDNVFLPEGSVSPSDFTTDLDGTISYDFLNRKTTLISQEELDCAGGYTVAIRVKPQKQLAEEDAALIRITKAGNSNAYLADGPYDLVLGSRGGLSLRFYPSGANQWVTSTETFATLPFDQYSEVVLAVADSQVNVYVDGKQVYGKDVSTLPNMNENTFFTSTTAVNRIQAAFGSSPWNGTEALLDAVKLYDYTLAAAQANIVFADDAIDKTALHSALQEADSMKPENCSAKDYQDLTALADAGRTVAQTPDSSQAECDAAASAIREQLARMKTKYEPEGVITAEGEYGQSLSEFLITGTIKNLETGEYVSGTFRWETANADQVYPKPNETVVYTVAFQLENGRELSGLPVTVTVKPRPVTIIADNVSRNFGTTVSPSDFTFKVVEGGLVLQDTKEDLGVVLGAQNAEAGTAGTYPIILNSWSNRNYVVTLQEGSSLTIEKAAAPGIADVIKNLPAAAGGSGTIQLAGLLPANAGGITGYTVASVEGSLELLSGTPECDASGNLSYSVNPGQSGRSIIITVQLSSVNYEMAAVKVVLKLTDKMVVEIQGITVEDKIYDGLPVAAAGKATVTNASGDSLTIENLNYNYTSANAAGYSSSVPPAAAGSYQLVVSVPETDPNYTGSTEPIGFKIAKRTVSITADSLQIVEGEPAPGYSYTVQGLADGENVESVQLDCRYQAGDPYGTYTILPANAIISGGNTNYDISYNSGQLTVKKKYTITFTGGVSAVGTAPVLGSAIAGVILKLPENTFQKEGYKFTGWLDGTVRYQPNSDYTMPERDVIFTAEWTKNEGPTPTPSISPEPTATPTPSISPEPTAAPTPSVSPEPTAAPTPSVNPQPTATPTPGISPRPTAIPIPTATPVPTEAPKVTITKQEDGSSVTVTSTVSKDTDGNKVTSRTVVETDAQGNITEQRQEIEIENKFGEQALIILPEATGEETPDVVVKTTGRKTTGRYRRGLMELQVQIEPQLLSDALAVANKLADEVSVEASLPVQEIQKLLKRKNVKELSIIVEVPEDNGGLQSFILPKELLEQARDANKTISVTLIQNGKTVIKSFNVKDLLETGWEIEDIDLLAEFKAKKEPEEK